MQKDVWERRDTYLLQKASQSIFYQVVQKVCVITFRVFFDYKILILIGLRGFQ